MSQDISLVEGSVEVPEVREDEPDSDPAPAPALSLLEPGPRLCLRLRWTLEASCNIDIVNIT